VLTRLLILWLLAEQPLHGYGIKRVLDDEGLRFWFALDFGSVYAVLRTLEREGLIEERGTEQEGARPPRRRYAITRSGREALAELLREAWLRLPPVGEPVDLALAAGSELDEEEVRELRGRRAAALRERLAQLRDLAPSAPAPELVDRQLALASAELAWLERLEDRDGTERTARRRR
jgi:DNA-binding PadR family transcriptional regulator